MKRTILRNRVKCLMCGDTIESRHRHDFVPCSCGNVAVDGGLDYIKRSFKTGQFTELSEFKETPQRLLRPDPAVPAALPPEPRSPRLPADLCLDLGPSLDSQENPAVD